MARWSRIPEGWAINLDGTDAAVVFSLPRVEVRSSSTGWQGVCLHADGKQTSCGDGYQGGSAVARTTALARAAAVLSPQHAEWIRAQG